MLITRLKLDYFGKFSGREIDLKPGINLIYGENEAGKSTLHAFIKGMLFGIERMRGRGAASKEDIYTRYLPWDYPGAYGGQMDILAGDKQYRLQRSFHANDRYFKIIDLETGREIKLKEGHISELIPGLNEAAFRNTVSMEQLKAQTDGELAAQVRNYITNLSIAKSREVDVKKAMEILKQKKKVFESFQYKAKLENLYREIEECREKIKDSDSLSAALSDMEAEKARLESELNLLTSSYNQKEQKLMDELPAIIERYRIYNEYMKQYSELTSQAADLKARINAWDDEATKGKAIENDLVKAQIMESELKKYGQILQNLDIELDEKIKTARKKSLIFTIILTSFAAVATFWFSKSAFLSLGTTAVTLAVVSIIRGFYNKTLNKNSGKDMQIKEVEEIYKKAESGLNRIFGIYQVSTLSELANKKEEHLKTVISLEKGREAIHELNDRIKALEDDLDELHDAIMLYMRNFIPVEELTPQALERLKEVINNKKQETESNIKRLEGEINSINLKIEKVKWELSQLENNEIELLKKKAQYEELKNKQKENEKEILALDLAIETINNLSQTIHDSFGKELNLAVSKIICDITDKRYKDLKIDEELNIQLGWNDKLIILDRLSAGTIDQVYFALRLAVSDLLFGKDNMPLILDDSFALYDDCRIKSALMQLTKRSQVLIFSCQMREQKILKEMGQLFNYIKL